jgi:hypothetical protein
MAPLKLPVRIGIAAGVAIGLVGGIVAVTATGGSSKPAAAKMVSAKANGVASKTGVASGFSSRVDYVVHFGQSASIDRVVDWQENTLKTLQVQVQSELVVATRQMKVHLEPNTEASRVEFEGAIHAAPGFQAVLERCPCADAP